MEEYKEEEEETLMRRIKEAKHKLTVTPTYLFPKSRSTRYKGIDQVEKHDAPFIKDFLVEFDDTQLNTINLNVHWRNLYVCKFSIKPKGVTFPSPLPFPSFFIKVKSIGKSYVILESLPAISEGIDIDFNTFFESFELHKQTVEAISDKWFIFLKLIKLENYLKGVV